MSAVFHADGPEPLVLPVSPNATVWVMSAAVAARNLAHAALADLPGTLPRAITLPALRITMADLVDAIGAHKGMAPDVHYDPDPTIEAQFGALPPLRAAAAESAGFTNDGDIRALVANAMPEHAV